MTDRELMQQALEALTEYDGTNGESKRKRVLAVLRERLAEPDYWRDKYNALAQPEQEPFCYHDGRNIVGKEYAHHCDVFPLYTEPQPEQEPLTDEQIQDVGRFVYCRGSTTEKLYQIMWNSQPSASIGWDRQELIAFARAIEAAHGIKEKNT